MPYEDQSRLSVGSYYITVQASLSNEFKVCLFQKNSNDNKEEDKMIEYRTFEHENKNGEYTW
ncbi:hypothetical protein AGMMS49531_03480 [Endomicrobiia bacterium]|nr:hypothetical protein AGMMS49531_03480 [Endomicrobiia bacterium]